MIAQQPHSTVKPTVTLVATCAANQTARFDAPWHCEGNQRAGRLAADVGRSPTKIGDTMDPDRIMAGISKELDGAMKAMSKATTAEEKVAYSKVIKNLCASLGVFLELASSMMPFDMDD